MICPDCKAEYRDGFARCADCGVALVEASSAILVSAHQERNREVKGDNHEDPFCEFWRGDDGRLLGELGQVLDEAGIPFRTLQLNDVLSMVGIPSRQAPYRIGVPFSMFERAEKAVAEAFGDLSDGENLGKFLTAGESE